MSAIDVVNTLAEAINNQRWDAAAAVLTDDFAATGLAPVTLSKPELIGGEQAWHVASPDRHISVENPREAGGTVNTRLNVSGTQTNTLNLPSLPPIPATGKRYVTTGNLTVTVRGEQVAALALEVTSPDVLEQLGVQRP